MDNRALTLSVVMAILAVFFVQSYVSSIEEETRKKFGGQEQNWEPIGNRRENCLL